MRITLSGTLKYFLDQEGEGGRWGWEQGLMFFTQTIFASKKITSYFFLHTKFPEVFSSLSGGIRAFVVLFWKT